MWDLGLGPGTKDICRKTGEIRIKSIVEFKHQCSFLSFKNFNKKKRNFNMSIQDVNIRGS